MDRITLKRVAVGFAALFLLSAAAPAADYNNKTRLTVNETIEVPGAILPPGEYVLKLVDSQSNRNIVRFFNADETEVMSTVIAIPNYRLEPTGDTQFAWYETPAGQPPAMRAWFYPGDLNGQEFVYPEGRATALAALVDRDMTTVADGAVKNDENPVLYRSIEVLTITPEKKQERDIEVAQVRNQERDKARPYRPTREPVLARTEPNTDNRTMAQAQPAPRSRPRQQPAPRPTTASRNLPETAGFAPLLALLGLTSLGGAAVVRKLRK